MFAQGRTEDVLRANLPLAFHPGRADDSALLQSYLDFVLEAGAAQLIRQNRALMERPDARLHLGAVSCPTLVMCGDSDQLTPPECSREIAALIKGSEFILLPQCGHMLTMERPTEVNAALLAWLAALAPAL
jgi:pimeloyl-ACP methyl ester carboxylesterase